MSWLLRFLGLKPSKAELDKLPFLLTVMTMKIDGAVDIEVIGHSARGQVVGGHRAGSSGGIDAAERAKTIAEQVEHVAVAGADIQESFAGSDQGADPPVAGVDEVGIRSVARRVAVGPERVVGVETHAPRPTQHTATALRRFGSWARCRNPPDRAVPCVRCRSAALRTP